MQYSILLQILDQICKEAPTPSKRYAPDSNHMEKINQARARAFIHLYLKVMFGITDFTARERTITDSTGDGGIDGYFIDSEAKTIYLIQSKFRTTQSNFEAKEISLEELLSMDINRVLEGEPADESGIEYNGKIRQFQREISAITDIARFTYKVVILANLSGIPEHKIRRLTEGYPAEIFDFHKTYEKLVFPVIAGIYFTAHDITIPVDLSNKNAGSKISYNVKTKYGECEITVLFVPTIEIAKIMDKYRNSILQYNPRSYLDLDGQSVNSAIRDTILNSKTNEFALFNNGITMLSDETNINEKIGQKNKAQLQIKNPQIINGGQTSFTLSRIYRDNIEAAEEIFKEKEVLLKIITVAESNSLETKSLLIDEISNATNKQTPVLNADKFANETLHIEIQRKVFDKHGLLYERKRGEFSDGVRDGYISKEIIIERNHFWRLLYSIEGKINRGFQKRLFQRNNFSDVLPLNDELLDKLFLAFSIFKKLRTNMQPHQILRKDLYAKVYIYSEIFSNEDPYYNLSKVDENLNTLNQKWEDFLNFRVNQLGPCVRMYTDKITGESKPHLNEKKYFNTDSFQKDLKNYFGQNGTSRVGCLDLQLDASGNESREGSGDMKSR